MALWETRIVCFSEKWKHFFRFFPKSRTTTYRLADLLPSGSGCDLAANTSSSALGISDNGIIVGTGVYNGAIHAYAMVLVPQLPSIVGLALGALVLARRGAK